MVTMIFILLAALACLAGLYAASRASRSNHRCIVDEGQAKRAKLEASGRDSLVLPNAPYTDAEADDALKALRNASVDYLSRVGDGVLFSVLTNLPPRHRLFLLNGPEESLGAACCRKQYQRKFGISTTRHEFWVTTVRRWGAERVPTAA